LDFTGSNLYQLNRAITMGAESGIFTLPKGPSGKVKLAPKAGASKEVSYISLLICCFLIYLHMQNSKPAVSGTIKKKPAVAKVTTTKKPATSKKILVGKSKAVPTKKSTAASRRAPAKKVRNMIGLLT